MTIKRTLLCLIAAVAVLSACKKTDDTPTFDAEKQFKADTTAIRAFVKANNLTAVKDTSGVFYILTSAGSGSYNYDNLNNTVTTVKYNGRLLNGSVFDKNQDGVSFTLGGVITAWQIALAPKAVGGLIPGGLQKGAKIRIIAPSYYCYGNVDRKDNSGNVVIPANSPLDFDIELLDVKTSN
ncbi:peptidylprolyl isomerase [Pedobacter sp. HMF7647]|uniref:Peptidyl-prolyl cis-trans isomerase n=1 Tax=Hufsiella arboris TaxID=2695275 RepID=A0A7K1YEB2_9SPHI|nr:FKBP-type peptidyl-prolyl cis-trans isomerase [Hufsiella arboris]MXV52947.1 peptidylprolyl isomerase [Hufsiella arboris]